LAFKKHSLSSEWSYRKKTVYNPLVIRNLTMFLKLFYDVCEGNEDIKRLTTSDSVCMTKKAVAGRGVVDESEDCGTYAATQPRGTM
jgi:hypothetical protein